MKVVLDGQVYYLKAGTGVTRTKIQEYPDNVRLDGQQTRKDRSNISALPITRWAGGLGIERRNYDVSGHNYRFWDAENIDTRWDGFLILSPAYNTGSVTPSLPILEFGFDYINQLYFAESQFGGDPDDPPARSIQGAQLYKFTAPNTLGSFKGLAGTYAGKKVGFLKALHNIGGNIVFVARDTVGTPHQLYYVPTFGATLYPILGISVMADTIEQAPPTASPQLADVGGTLHVFSYDSANQRLKFYLANRDLGSLTCVATQSEIVGSYLAPLISTGVDIYAQAPGGIYHFDDMPNKVIDTSSTRDQNTWQTQFRNYLHFKSQYSLVKYDGFDLAPIGYDQDDGLPSNLWGQITAGVSTQKFIFAAVKGPTYSNILAYNGLSWQYYARIPTPGAWVSKLFISNLPDNIDRLWCLYPLRTSYETAIIPPGYFLNPLTNPLQAATYTFVPTGHITFPIDDGGIIEQAGGYFDATVVGDSINANEKLTLLYGLDGANPTATLGVVATTMDIVSFGSPYGITGNRIQPKIMFTSSAAGTSPVLRSIIYSYLKIPNTRETFDFTIDLRETARAEVKPLEAVIGSLDYVGDKRTLSTFFYGQLPTKTIRVLDIPASEVVDTDDIYLGEREGFIRVRVAEII